ncbi:MAG: hypothetical protein IK130_08335, partial [Oscillospiraceae bacterium]|nr:hypothetical protein [Oscillospiraceae bacterium]
MTAAVYYDVMFIISILLTIVYAMLWHKHFDLHVTLLFIFIPIANAGYMLVGRARNAEMAMTATKMVYLGGCYLLLFSMFAVLSLCHVHIPRWGRGLMIGFTTVIYLSVLSIGYTELFYKSLKMEIIDGEAVVTKEYGIMHTVCYVMIVLYFLISLVASVYSWFRKHDVSNRTIVLVFIPEAVALIGYFLRGFTRLEVMPVVYIVAQVLYLMIVRRMLLYDIVDSSIDSLVDAGATGFISFDLQYRYLGSNETARKIVPELNTLTVDKPVKGVSDIGRDFLRRLSAFRADDKWNAAHLERDGKCYQVTVNDLVDGRRRRGYQLLLTDDTDNQKLIHMMQDYSSDLEKEVA